MNLEDLKKLCDEATPGPWTVSDAGGEFQGPYILSPNCGILARHTHYHPMHADAAFIAAARTAMPLLIKVAEAADRFVFLRKTSHDGDEIHAALEVYYSARAALDSDAEGGGG